MKAIDLSRYIVSKCIIDNSPVNNIQLQGILYCIQRNFLKRDKKAFEDSFEAWQIGAVVPDVYRYFCGYGVTPIQAVAELYNMEDSADKLKIDKIIEKKRQLNSWDMMSEVKRKGKAWYRVYQCGAGDKHVIPANLIKRKG